MINWEASSFLTNVTHIDGRNAAKLTMLKPIFSEFGFMKMRLEVMIKYVLHIARKIGKLNLSTSDIDNMLKIYTGLTIDDAKRVKKYEKVVNHDMKALELFLISSLKRSHLFRLIPYVNLGIGSEDINNIAIAMQLDRSRGEVMVPLFKEVAACCIAFANKEKDTVMIARTHGQPANVTTFGKEVASTLFRLCDEIEIFQHSVLDAKCSGEVGSFQAQFAVHQTVDWMDITDSFIRSFGFNPTHGATQITPYDSIVRYLQSVQRINTILLDFVKNMWLYILLGYLKVKKISSEVGSAGMPHKVNPIYFEGAEGGFTLANGIIETLARTLMINRLDSDFSDSTMRRNIVTPIALSVLSYQSIIEALKRTALDHDVIEKDIETHQEVWIETIKVYATAHGISDAYEILKKKTRGLVMTVQDLVDLIETLPLTRNQKKECLSFCGEQVNPYPSKIVEEALRKTIKLLSL